MTTGDIRIKRIYDAPVADDGTRVLVDRLWPRGVSRATAALDLWLPDVAPSPGLRTWFGHDPDRFCEFKKRYEVELNANREAIGSLLSLVGPGRLTLLYAAHDRVHNHATVLADHLRSIAVHSRPRVSQAPI